MQQWRTESSCPCVKHLQRVTEIENTASGHALLSLVRSRPWYSALRTICSASLSGFT